MEWDITLTCSSVTTFWALNNIPLCLPQMQRSLPTEGWTSMNVATEEGTEWDQHQYYMPWHWLHLKGTLARSFMLTDWKPLRLCHWISVSYSHLWDRGYRTQRSHLPNLHLRPSLYIVGRQKDWNVGRWIIYPPSSLVPRPARRFRLHKITLGGAWEWGSPPSRRLLGIL